jgi:hypothetical protein
MTVEKVVCDECGRIKDHANHWHEILISTHEDGMIAIHLGYLDFPIQNSASWNSQAHDLCGEACFYRHIGKLLLISSL